MDYDAAKRTLHAVESSKKPDPARLEKVRPRAGVDATSLIQVVSCKLYILCYMWIMFSRKISVWLLMTIAEDK